MTVQRDLTCTCVECGAFDVPAILDRQPLPPHYDPVTGKLCPNRGAAMMLLRCRGRED